MTRGRTGRDPTPRGELPPTTNEAAPRGEPLDDAELRRRVAAALTDQDAEQLGAALRPSKCGLGAFATADEATPADPGPLSRDRS